MECSIAPRVRKVVQNTRLGVAFGATVIFCSTVFLAGIVAIGVLEGIPSLLFGARQPD
jgi:hypothetical protein